LADCDAVVAARGRREENKPSSEDYKVSLDLLTLGEKNKPFLALNKPTCEDIESACFLNKPLWVSL